MADPAILRFLEVFSRTLDPAAAAADAGVDQREAEQALQRSKALQRRLRKLFDQRVAIFDHVPVAVVRAELLSIMANPEIQPGHRVNASKLLIDLISEPGDDKRAMVGKLLKAVAASD